MSERLRAALSEALASPVHALAAVHGGDIHRAFRARLADGTTVFVKTSDDAPSDMFAKEARGLAWLAEARSLRVPRVLAVLEDPRALVLEWIARGAREDEEALGRGLAALHRAGAPSFGHVEDNYLASIAVDDRPRADWPTFYGEARLIPLAALAHRGGALDAGAVRRIERLARALPQRVGPAEPPARLHGDLWSGNVIGDAIGGPVLIDPAVFGGHREIDLAMMRLFGGFSPRTFAAYHEAFPLASGHEERVPLYQLLPLLAHAVLFGGGWAPRVASVLGRLD